jgi:hypothetical protein
LKVSRQRGVNDLTGFDWFLVVLVAIHLLAVNLAAAGPMVAPLAELRGTRRRLPEFDVAALGLAKCSILAAAIGFGLGLLALAALTIWSPVGESAYFAAIRQVTLSRWWFTGGEILFYFVCMAAYVLLWRRLARFRLAHRAIAVAAGANLLYHFPALFTILSLLVERPELHEKSLDRQLYLKLLFDAETLARVFHVWLASFAVAGVVLAWIGLRATRRQENGDGRAVATFGGRVALVVTLLQVPVGVWVSITLPEAQQQRAMGGNVLCTALFGASIIMALALMHQLAMLSLGDATKKRVGLASLLMAGVVLLMTATLHLARAG